MNTRKNPRLTSLIIQYTVLSILEMFPKNCSLENYVWSRIGKAQNGPNLRLFISQPQDEVLTYQKYCTADSDLCERKMVIHRSYIKLPQVFFNEIFKMNSKYNLHWPALSKYAVTLSYGTIKLHGKLMECKEDHEFLVAAHWRISYFE